MKVQMLATYSCPKGSIGIGQVADLSKPLAKVLIAGGYAKEASASAKIDARLGEPLVEDPEKTLADELQSDIEDTRDQKRETTNARVIK